MKLPPRKFMIGYRPAVYARQGLIWGMRNPFDGPVFETSEEAEEWCFEVIVDHHGRGFESMADAEIHPFKGMVDCYRPGPPGLREETARICREVAEEERRRKEREGLDNKA